MSNITPLPISFWSRIRLWWNGYKARVGKRMKYLERKSKE